MPKGAAGPPGGAVASLEEPPELEPDELFDAGAPTRVADYPDGIRDQGPPSDDDMPGFTDVPTRESREMMAALAALEVGLVENRRGGRPAATPPPEERRTPLRQELPPAPPPAAEVSFGDEVAHPPRAAPARGRSTTALVLVCAALSLMIAGAGAMLLHARAQSRPPAAARLP